jgi:polyhydroxybutyrate depolymerase
MRQRSSTRFVGGMLMAVVLLAGGCAGSAGDPATPSSSSAGGTSGPAAASPSPACQDGAPRPAVEQIDVTVNGTPRTAVVHLPAATIGTEPLPVVLSFHGLSGNPAVQEATDGLTTKADEKGFVVVYPEGLPVGLNDQITGVAGWDPDGSEVDEVAFVTALLDELGTRVCVDTSRVYATGFSAGAYLASTLACEIPDRIAAVAPVSGAYQSTACASDRPTPIMAFHGVDDIWVPYDGRQSATAGTFVPVLDAIAAQATRNGCTGGPDVQDVTPTVQRLTWTGCAAPTVLYRLEGHGHAWPGHPLPYSEDLLVGVLAGGDGQAPEPLMVAIGEAPEAMAANVLLTNVTIDATDLIWDFFDQAR